MPSTKKKSPKRKKMKTMKAWAVVEKKGDIYSDGGGDLYVSKNKSWMEANCNEEDGERVQRVRITEL